MSGSYVHNYADAEGLGRDLLGGKGIGLAQMKALGIPVPDGFVVTTAACVEYMRRSRQLPPGLEDDIARHLERLERQAGKRFGDPDDPLLVSVRSGAAVSMPGMMDTILNLGLNAETAKALGRSTGNPRFAFDSYRRLVQMYGEVVDGIEPHLFERELARLRDERGARQDVDLVAEDLAELASRFEAI
jgi:pyruvate,orthophosphate dikinase